MAKDVYTYCLESENESLRAQLKEYKARIKGFIDKTCSVLRETGYFQNEEGLSEECMEKQFRQILEEQL